MGKNLAYRKFKDLPINGKQKTVISMARRQLNIDEETYRDMLEQRFQVRSSTKLTFNQASLFIQELERKGFTLLPGKKPAVKKVKAAPSRKAVSRSDSKVVALATREELEKINQVAALIEWREENGLALFLEKRMKVKGGKVRTSQEAYLAIEGLKGMFENGMKKKHGVNWWGMQFPEQAVMEYIRLHRPAEWRPTLRVV